MYECNGLTHGCDDSMTWSKDLTNKHEEKVEPEREGETDREAHGLGERYAEESGLVKQRERLEHGNSWNRSTFNP